MARWPDPAFNTEQSEQQQAYGRQLWNTSREAGSEIAKARIVSFLEQWTYARDWRGGLAGDRGSAAKKELSVRSIAQARGIGLPPLQHSNVLDLEAMTTSRADFVKKYASYFSRPPDMHD